MKYDRPITIQHLNDETEQWADWAHLHASVNKAQGSEYTDAGATRSVNTLTFKCRFYKHLKDVQLNTQFYRIVFDGAVYNIEDTDDFMLQHREFKMTAASYGG